MRNNTRTKMEDIGEDLTIRTGESIRIINGQHVIKSKPTDDIVTSVSPAEFVRELRSSILRASGVRNLANAIGYSERIIKYWQIGRRLPRPHVASDSSRETLAEVFERVRRFKGLPSIDGPVELKLPREKTIEPEIAEEHTPFVELKESPVSFAPRPRQIAANKRRR